LRAARSICTLGLCCLLLCACADTVAETPPTYVVRPDDTLYSIAWRHDLDFRDLARWNGIGTDFRISVGQVLVLAPGAQVSTRRAAPRAVPKPAPAPPAAGRRASQETWIWPTERAGAPRPVPGGGILLAGRLGQDVRAASAGRVVYAGSGLRGYGNLIIIKHADSLLSAYAHNREMLVHDGEDVAAGQVIAHMGESPQHSPVLYFEIRQNGRPVDPLPFLPRGK
jgi:lipoprotein NlpD